MSTKSKLHLSLSLSPVPLQTLVPLLHTQPRDLIPINFSLPPDQQAHLILATHHASDYAPSLPPLLWRAYPPPLPRKPAQRRPFHNQ